MSGISGIVLPSRSCILFYLKLFQYTWFDKEAGFRHIHHKVCSYFAICGRVLFYFILNIFKKKYPANLEYVSA